MNKLIINIIKNIALNIHIHIRVILLQSLSAIKILAPNYAI